MAGLAPQTPATVLDAGCGSGKGAQALRLAGFTVTMADLTDKGLIPEVLDLQFREVCLWEYLPTQLHCFDGCYDYVYSCDVLEHIPLPFTMLVVSNLLGMAKKGVFLSICLRPDHLGVWVGQSLHHSVQSFTEWKEQLSALAEIKECRDLLSEGLFYLVPRRS